MVAKPSQLQAILKKYARLLSEWVSAMGGLDLRQRCRRGRLPADARFTAHPVIEHHQVP